MVAFRLSDLGDPVDELDARHETLELECLGEPHVALGILDGPAVELLQALADLVAGHRGSARLALDAVPLGQGFGIGHGLMVAASPAGERGVKQNRGWVELSFPPGAQAHCIGRLAQRESACLTRKRSLVETQRRPPPGSWPRRLVDSDA